MKKSAYSNNAAATTAPIDRHLRCEACIVSGGDYGEPRVGVLWISEVLRVNMQDGTPYRDIGRVLRCGNPECTRPPAAKLWKAGFDMGILESNAYALVKACPGVPDFTLIEFLDGKVEPVPLPAGIVDIFRPKFGEPEPRPAPAPSLYDQAEAPF